MAKKVTINMVAEKAQVSRGTVDRVLNRRPHVRTDVRERVLKTMKELGYVPIKEEQALALGLKETPEKIKLGIIIPDEQGYLRSELTRGITDAKNYLNSLNTEVIIETCETVMVDETLEIIDKLTKEKVSGIALSSRKNDEAIVNKARQLKEAKIPVITFNSDLPESDRLLFVGQDLIKSGRIAAELMSKCIRNDENILIAVGNSQMDAHKQRLRGFCGRMREKGFRSGSMDIIETYNDYERTYNKVREAFEKRPEIKGIYMANHSVSGCVEALRSIGKGDGSVRIICHDMTSSTKRLISKGAVDFVITQDIYNQGYQPLILLYKYIRGDNISDLSWNESSINIICSENLNAN